MKIERRGPDSEPKKMRYFKIPLCRIFYRKSGSDNTCQWHLRSKIEVWQLYYDIIPYSSFI